jgi:phosphate:Na+ symporter
VQRLLPARETSLQRALDPSALASPVIAVETARRVVAGLLTTTTAGVSAALAGGTGPAAQGTAAFATLAEVRDFLAELKEPPETEDERLRMTSTLHAIDHAARLVEVLADGGLRAQQAGTLLDRRAAGLCAQAMRAAQVVGASITSECALSTTAAPIGWSASPEVAAALDGMESSARELDALQREHRAATLASVAPGKLTVSDAFARIDIVRRLDRVAHHAWRSTAHLLGRGARSGV